MQGPPTPTPTPTPLLESGPDSTWQDQASSANQKASIRTEHTATVGLATSSQIETPTPTQVPTVLTSASSPAPPSVSSTPVNGHRLFINGRQVMPDSQRFFVPLGVVTLHLLPGPRARYPPGAEVGFEVEVHSLGAGLEVTGADSVEESLVRVLMNADRFVRVFIWPRPTRSDVNPPSRPPTGTERQTPRTKTPRPSPTRTATPSATPSPALHKKSPSHLSFWAETRVFGQSGQSRTPVPASSMRVTFFEAFEGKE